MKPLTWQSVSSEALQLLKSLPMCQACTCGRVLALAQVQVLQNSGSQMEIQEEKNYREHSNAWYLFFLLWLGCLFAKIEDVGVQLPDIALRKKASSTLSPGSPLLQVGSIAMALATASCRLCPFRRGLGWCPLT